MIKFETTSGSVYEIDTSADRYRKGDGEWINCRAGMNFSEPPKEKYQSPIVGGRYLICSSYDKDVLTTAVKKVL